MTYKQTMTMDNTMGHVETSAIQFGGYFAKLKNLVTIKIPVGYQDENGFHTGVKPDDSDLHWPANW